MIDICNAGAQVSLDKIKSFTKKPIGILLHTVLTGVVGIIILIAFLAMALSPAALKILLPAIIGFNGAIVGYNLINRGGSRFPWKKTCLAITAMTLAITGCLALFLLYPWSATLDISRYLFSGGMALATTFSGAWLATKSEKLNQANALLTDEEEDDRKN
jgi:hypothetical protein